ncbi:MAG: sulfatase-like hydrolase/transferase [Bryobacteraceae bacterium]
MTTSRWHVRWLLLALVIAVPFAGFLVTNHYPWFRIETVVALALLLLTCAVLSAVARGRWFYVVTLVCGCAIAVVPVDRVLLPLGQLPVPAVAAGFLIFFGGLMFWMRERFWASLVTFVLAAFTAHCIVVYRSPAAFAYTGSRPVAGQKPSHFLYLILDEHIGPAGLPKSIPECQNAARMIVSTFGHDGFRLYPNAFSNYATTLDSVPSILNRTLLRSHNEFLRPGSPDPYGMYSLNATKFFSDFKSRGYALEAIQCRGVNFASGSGARVLEYTGGMDEIARSDMRWHEKFRVLVGAYQGSDVVLAGVKGFFPFFRFGTKTLWPMSVSHSWPTWLASEITSTEKPTLFFVHLLTPHGPYAYRPNGSMRSLNEWTADLSYGVSDDRTYRDRYVRYAQQIEYLHEQLGHLFSELRKRGFLDRMTIVVHGDHGSRIRLRRDSVRPASGSRPVEPDRYDYISEADPQDLVDRFSALLAIKFPGERVPSVDGRSGSVVHFLTETVYGRNPADIGPGVDSVFLFGAHDLVTEIAWPAMKGN